jgi:hypothetical protein
MTASNLALLTTTPGLALTFFCLALLSDRPKALAPRAADVLTDAFGTAIAPY